MREINKKKKNGMEFYLIKIMIYFMKLKMGMEK